MKYIFILFAFIYCNSSFSQVKPIFEIESGYYDYRAMISKYNKVEYNSNVTNYRIYTNIITGVKFKNVTFNQTLENFFSYKNGRSFNVGQIRYITSLYFEKNRIKIGYEHMCFHPVVSAKTEMDNLFYSSSDKISIKLKIL